jgi:hypothetical protein
MHHCAAFSADVFDAKVFAATRSIFSQETKNEGSAVSRQRYDDIALLACFQRGRMGCGLP